MSWGGVISLLCIFLVCVALTGCVQSRPDGWCVVSVNGACLSTVKEGKPVASGDVDMRYAGIKCVTGWDSKECSGSVETTVREWDYPSEDNSSSNVSIY